MSESKLVSSLQTTLDQALAAEARDDKAAAVAKTAAIKNIQKALTARILKRLDDGQPLVEVARKMKAIEGMQPQINDMERRLGIMQSVEPVLENAIKTLQKVVDVRGMGKKWAPLAAHAPLKFDSLLKLPEMSNWEWTNLTAHTWVRACHIDASSGAYSHIAIRRSQALNI